MGKIVFLDRDGVINHDSPNYIKCWDEFEFLPGSLEALKMLTLHNFHIILITNQSAINRKIMLLEELEHINRMLIKAVNNSGGNIMDIFFCPHTNEDNCDCRKPKPGLLIEAQRKYNIDFSCSYMIGDSVRDIETAHNAGCKFTILVQTGNGIEAKKKIEKKYICVDYIGVDLYDASKWIIEKNFQI